MHSAGAALRHAASILCPRKTELLTNDPKQRSGRVDIEIDAFAVNREAHHRSSPDSFGLHLDVGQGRRDAVDFTPATAAATGWWFNKIKPTRKLADRPGPIT